MAIDIERAMKDAAYRESLDQAELKACLATAAAKKALDEADLEMVTGGTEDPVVKQTLIFPKK